MDDRELLAYVVKQEKENPSDDLHSLFMARLRDLQPNRHLRDKWIKRLFNGGLIDADLEEDGAGNIALFRLRDVTAGGRELAGTTESNESTKTFSGNKVFIIHGHNNGVKEAVARLVTDQDLEPVILHEQADSGRTIMEKFEDHAAEARYAIAILTADDKTIDGQSRARQNVVFEHGYFVAQLDRANVCALVEDSVEVPSDLSGILYKKLSDSDWKFQLLKEMQASGLDIDLNKLK